MSNDYLYNSINNPKKSHYTGLSIGSCYTNYLVGLPAQLLPLGCKHFILRKRIKFAVRGLALVVTIGNETLDHFILNYMTRKQRNSTG